MRKLVLLFLASISMTGCQTVFYGKPKVEGGPAACEKKCQAWGLQFAGMVALGDYTDGCICRVKGSTLSMNDVAQTLVLSSAGASGGVTGVYMQQQRAAAQHASAH